MDHKRANWKLRTYFSFIIIMFIFFPGCGQSPSTSVSIPSPDGSLLLKSSVNQNKSDPATYLRVVVEIKDLYGNRVFRETTPASDTMRWSLRWVSNQEILLDSAEIGRYVIRRVQNKQWVGGYEKANPQT
ncbi:MAG: hypothetical protein JRF72_09955 [Deltaproteobacteria bacterium]|jgi:hypothetical protein|nr:hypothetical protein [Deltaproteobacteria bacterium]